MQPERFTSNPSRSNIATGLGIARPTQIVRSAEMYSTSNRDQNTTDTLSKTCNDIVGWITSQEVCSSQKEKRIAQLFQSIESYRKQISSLQEENQKLTSSVKDELDQRSEVIRKFQVNKELCVQLSRQFDSFKKQLALFEECKKEKEERVKEYEEHIDHITNQFQEMKDSCVHEVEALKEEIIMSQQNAVDIERKCQLLLDDQDAEMTNLGEFLKQKNVEICNYQSSIEDFKRRVESLSNEKVDLDAEIAQTKVIVEEHSARIKDLEDFISKSEAEKEKLLSEYETVCKDFNLLEVENMDREETFNKFKDQSVKDIQALQVHVENLERDLDVKLQTEIGLQDKLNSCSAELCDMERVKDNLGVQIDELNTEMEKQHSLMKAKESELLNKIDVYEIDKNNFLSKLQICAKILEEKDDEVLKFQNEKKELDLKNASLLSESENLKKQIYEKDLDNKHFKDKVASLNTELKQKEEKIFQIQGEKYEVQNQLIIQENKYMEAEKDYKKAIEDHMQQLCVKEENVKNLQEELSSVKAYSKSLDNDSSSNSKKNKLCEEEIDSLKEKLCQKEKELADLAKTIEEAKMMLNHLKQNSDSLEKELKTTKEAKLCCETDFKYEKIKLEGILKNKDETIKKLERSVFQMKKNVRDVKLTTPTLASGALKDKISVLERTINEREKEIANLKTQREVSSSVEITEKDVLEQKDKEIEKLKYTSDLYYRKYQELEKDHSTSIHAKCCEITALKQEVHGLKEKESFLEYEIKTLKPKQDENKTPNSTKETPRATTSNVQQNIFSGPPENANTIRKIPRGFTLHKKKSILNLPKKRPEFPHIDTSDSDCMDIEFDENNKLKLIPVKSKLTKTPTVPKKMVTSTPKLKKGAEKKVSFAPEVSKGEEKFTTPPVPYKGKKRLAPETPKVSKRAATSPKVFDISF